MMAAEWADLGAVPAYSYVPGGPWPHPRSDARGHSAHQGAPKAGPIEDGRWAASAAYLRGVMLFNAGYYWEAHEAWEALWHAHGRRGATAELLRALIKLAAAGVKVREGQTHGIVTHARRAQTILESVRQEVGPRHLGLDLDALIGHAQRVAETPPRDTSPPGTAVTRVFDFTIQPE